MADLTFRRGKLSNGVVDDLLHLWAANNPEKRPPFANSKDLDNTIDAIKEGSAPWQSFTVGYHGEVPDDDPPGWMSEEFVVWHRDPRTVIHNMLANPEFAKDFAYSPYRQFDGDSRRWSHFMSGNWAWRQAVRSCFNKFEYSKTDIMY